MSREDFAALSNVILEHATRAIVEDGALFPIGATLSVDEILRTFRTLANEKQVRAVAWCVDMRVVPPGSQEKTDALMLFCESIEGTALVVMNPYADAPGPNTKFMGRHVLSTEPQVFCPRA